MVIDWTALVFTSYLICPLVVYPLALSQRSSFVVQYGVIVVALPLAWSFGLAPGTKALGLQLVQGDGRRPRIWRAVVRALIAVPGGFGAAVLGLGVYGLWMGHYPSGAEADPNWRAWGLFLAIALVYFASTMASLWDEQGRGLHDRLSGTHVLALVAMKTARAPLPPVAGPVAPFRRRWLAVAAAATGSATFCSIGLSGFLAEGSWGWVGGLGLTTFLLWGVAWALSVYTRIRRGSRRQLRWYCVTGGLAVSALFLLVIGGDALTRQLWLEGAVALSTGSTLGLVAAAASRATWRLQLTALITRAAARLAPTLAVKQYPPPARRCRRLRPRSRPSSTQPR